MLHALLLPWLTEQEAQKSCAVSESLELGSAPALEEAPAWSQSRYPLQRHTPASLGWATACVPRGEGRLGETPHSAGHRWQKPGQDLWDFSWEVPELEMGQAPPWRPGAAQTSAENHEFFLFPWGGATWPSRDNICLPVLCSCTGMSSVSEAPAARKA